MQQSISALVLCLMLGTSAAARPPYAPGKDPSEQVAPAPAGTKGSAGPAVRKRAAGTPVETRPEPQAAPVAALYEQALEGDTLFAISRRRQVPLRALIEANALEPPFALVAGQYLRLPPPRIHVVEADETLFSVSRRFNVDLRSLALLNGLGKPWMVAPGDRLVLPVLARDNRESGVRGLATATTTTSSGQASATPAGPVPRVRAPTAGAPATAGGPSASGADRIPAQAGSTRPVMFLWPARGALLRAFGPQAGGQRLDGLQMALPDSAAISAAAAGIVVYRGEDLPGFGKLMLIKHEGGWVTAYAHLGRFVVEEGANVQPGQIIAEAGRPPSTPLAAAPVQHTRAAPASLHFEIRNPRGRPVDPQSLIGRL